VTKTKSILAGICVFLFIVSGFTALLLFNVERKAFSADTYKQAFKEQGVYDDPAGLFEDMAMNYAVGPNGALGILSILNKDDLKIVITALLPPQDLEVLTNGFLDSIFNFLNGKTDSVTVSLKSVKQNLTGEPGLRSVTQILQSKPDCTSSQLMQMGLGMLFTDGGMTLCKPPDELMELVTPVIESQLQLMAGSLPDELSVDPGGQVGSSNDFRPLLSKLRTFMKLSLLLPLFLLLAITFLAVRTLEEWLRWWGIPFLVTGILGTATVFVTIPLIPSMLGTIFLQGGFTMPVAIQELIRNVADSLTREILKPAAIQSIALTLTGALMVIIRAITNRDR
jgi:hypothetical protein